MSAHKQIVIAVSMNEDDNAVVCDCKECADIPGTRPTLLLIFITAPYCFVKNHHLVRLHPTRYICPRAAVFA